MLPNPLALWGLDFTSAKSIKKKEGGVEWAIRLMFLIRSHGRGDNPRCFYSSGQSDQLHKPETDDVMTRRHPHTYRTLWFGVTGGSKWTWLKIWYRVFITAAQAFKEIFVSGSETCEMGTDFCYIQVSADFYLFWTPLWLIMSGSFKSVWCCAWALTVLM